MNRSMHNADKADAESPKAKAGHLLPSTLAETWLDRLTKFYLIPEGVFMAQWDRFLVAVTVANCLMLPFMAAFQYIAIEAWIVSYLIDLIFLADIYIRFHIAYLQNGFWVVFPKEMALNYLISWDFKYDVIANIPFDLIALGWSSYGTEQALVALTLIRLPKLIRIAKILMYFQRIEKKLHARFIGQIIKFLVYLMVATNTVACCWFALACNGGITKDLTCSTNSWVSSVKGPPTMNNTIEADLQDPNWVEGNRGYLYIRALYWTVTTMTTTGYGDLHASTDAERMFSILAMLFGIFFYGYISGTIASTLSNLDSRRVGYQQKMTAVIQYMNDREMDGDMQERVINYYDYVWDRNRGIDAKALFVDLPTTFKSEVAMSLNNAIIDKVSIFKGCSEGFRRMIAISMKLYLFTANEYVVHTNDLGLEMYFITQGRIDIFASADSKRPISSLIEGGHFGEYCVILNHRHEYDVRAVCNTDIYVLTKEEIENAFSAYPDDREKVLAETESRYKQHQATKKGRKAMQQIENDEDLVLTPPIQSNTTTISLIPPIGKRKSSVANSGYLVADDNSLSANQDLIKKLHSVRRGSMQLTDVSREKSKENIAKSKLSDMNKVDLEAQVQGSLPSEAITSIPKIEETDSNEDVLFNRRQSEGQRPSYLETERKLSIHSRKNF
ncbi:Kinesin-like protein kif27 [Nowakowskiella sp. JEL0407]|nr:Kinesin-like protein kif27 [Nowakowskiella sp. JEL0407]